MMSQVYIGYNAYEVSHWSVQGQLAHVLLTAGAAFYSAPPCSTQNLAVTVISIIILSTK